MSKTQNSSQAVYDARTLGKPKMLVLGLQHMFAMFGATVLVPAITGLPVSTTLLFAGLGTLLFHLLTKMKVPAFLGSSFAFIGGYLSIVEMGKSYDLTASQSLPYACIGVACAGFLYFVLAGLFKAFGAKKVMKFFPPVVTGPIIICNIWGRGMIKIVPILIGVLVSYVLAACFGLVDFSAVKDAAWIGLPVYKDCTALAIADTQNWEMLTTAIITIMPIALATMIEHIGDMCAISSTTGKNYLQDPGLHRTLMGDGLATALASLFGAPANTTYGENTGVLNLTKVYDPRVIRIAALFAILFSFCPKFAAVVSAMPAATIGGVSLILYGMISAVGVRNVVENKVDFSSSRNVIIAAIILVLGIGINYGIEGGSIDLGFTKLSALAIAALVDILLNAILPGKDYEFGKDPQGDTAVNFDANTNRVTE